MTVMFISTIAALAAFLLLRFIEGSAIQLRHQPSSRVLRTAALLIPAFLATSAFAVALPQAVTPKPPTQPEEGQSKKSESSVEVTVTSQAKASSDDSSDETAFPDPEGASDLLIVITREGLNQLIEASGGDIQAFDLSRLKRASSLVPLSDNQSQALRPVLQTAASPIMLDRLFHPANVKVIQSFLRGPVTEEPAEQNVKNEQRDQFFRDHPWINDPGIGQIVAKTRMIEANRPDEIASQVRDRIRESVASKVQELAKERFGVDKVDPSLLKDSFFDPGKTIVQSAPWEEYVGTDDDREDAMVQTYVLVELPSDEIESVMSGIKTEIQKRRIALLCITVGLAWLGIALSSIAFRTFHTESRFWKLVVIPVLCLAVIPCLTGAGLMIGEMATGNLL